MKFKILLIFLILTSSYMLADKPDKFSTATFTLREQTFLVTDIPQNNKNAAKAHIRASLEQQFQQLKNDFINNILEFMDAEPEKEAQTSCSCHGCWTSWSNGVITGCVGTTPHDCECCICIAPKLPPGGGEPSPK